MRSFLCAVALSVTMFSSAGLAGEPAERPSDSEILLQLADEAALHGTQAAEPACPDEQCQRGNPPRRFGTAIDWARSPAEAFKRSERESKLVFLVHLSGNFEKSEFT